LLTGLELSLERKQMPQIVENVSTEPIPDWPPLARRLREKQVLGSLRLRPQRLTIRERSPVHALTSATQGLTIRLNDRSNVGKQV